MLFALDQKKKSDRETPPNLTYFQIPTPLSKNGLDKSCVAPSTHIVKKCMENSPFPQTTPPIPSNLRWLESELLKRKMGMDRPTKPFVGRPPGSGKKSPKHPTSWD